MIQNLYIYGTGNPVNYVDSSEHLLVSTVVLVGIGIDGIIGVIIGTIAGYGIGVALGEKTGSGLVAKEVGQAIKRIEGTCVAKKKERQWRFLHCQYIKMRKECIIKKHSSIFIGVVLFCILLYIECFYSYVKINVNDKTKMNQNNSVVITDTEQNIKFKTHIKLKSNQSGSNSIHEV